MRKIYLRVLLFCFTLSILTYESLHSQDRVVSGSVTEASGSGIPGATVLIKGTQDGTVTDFEGNFKIEITNPESILVFSAIGYKKKQINVGSKSQIDVVLNEDVKQLGEVVVTALGVERE